MTDYMKEAGRLAQAYADAVLLGEGNDEALAALLAHIQRGAVPEGWNLDESEAALLHHLTSPDDEGEHSPITLRAGNVRMDDGTVKFGLLCEYTDYPDEGATLLVERPETAPDHFRDAAKMMAVQPSCMTCGDHGMVGGLLPNGGGYEAHSCPDCTAPAPAEPERRIGPASDADMAVYQSIADGYSTRAPAPADDRIAAALHYPECWDTAAYPTVESALAEVFAHYRCTEHDAPAEVPMPEPCVSTYEGYRDSAGEWHAMAYSADQMRNYGAACRAAGEAAGYTRGLAEAGRDAERYRWLRRHFAIVGTDNGAVFHALNLPTPTHIAPDAAIELDASIDAALRGEATCKHGIRSPHECRACADEPTDTAIAEWLRGEVK